MTTEFDTWWEDNKKYVGEWIGYKEVARHYAEQAWVEAVEQTTKSIEGDKEYLTECLGRFDE